jgi:hypothetical protein
MKVIVFFFLSGFDKKSRIAYNRPIEKRPEGPKETETKHMKKLIACLIALCLLLTACGGWQERPAAEEGGESETPAREGESPAREPAGDSAETGETSPAPTPEPTPEPTPAPTKPPYLSFPDGSIHDYGETDLDLSWLRHEDAAAVAELLREMPALKSVELGADDARAAEEAGEEPPEADAPARLSWTDIRVLQEAAPQAEFFYRFRFYGKDFCLQDESVDLNHRSMDDEGAEVRAMLRCMKRCSYLDMDFCGVSDEAMAAIREEFPQIEVVWRIWFGRDNKLSVRTDVERILASDGGMHIEDNCSGLQYCTKVKYLDMGHMPELEDWSFLGCMPELEVVVISIGCFDLDDLAGLANCPHLEYLEMCSRSTREEALDLSFLAGLTELKHLNICCLYDVTGYEALETLTGLERLWIGCHTNIPPEYIAHLQEVLPNTEFNLTTEVGDGWEWRWTDATNQRPNDRYYLLIQQFDYGHYDRVCALYWNDPLYKPHD